MQLTSHARSFVRTTILGAFSSIALIILAGIIMCIPWWASSQQLLPQWQMWTFVVLVTAALLAVASATTLVAIGGFVVVVRDFCEERGLPYLSAQPREDTRAGRTVYYQRAPRQANDAARA